MNKMDHEIQFDTSGGTIEVSLLHWNEELQQFMASSLATAGLKVPVMDQEDLEFNAAIDGVESLLLQMATVGIDIESEPMKRAIKEALQGICNNL